MVKIYVNAKLHVIGKVKKRIKLNVRKIKIKTAVVVNIHV